MEYDAFYLNQLQEETWEAEWSPVRSPPQQESAWTESPSESTPSQQQSSYEQVWVYSHQAFSHI